jgi:hypothetical protein
VSAEEKTAPAFGPGLSLGLLRTRAAGSRKHPRFSLPVELEAVAPARPDPA